MRSRSRNTCPARWRCASRASWCRRISKANLPVFRIGLKCFFEEGRALARIVHPNVVRVLNFFRANDTVYMVMAYESGHSLQEHIPRLAAQGAAAPAKPSSARSSRSVCGGLREVHANKLLHLDLKPANIYLRTDGTPILLDFGAARQTINTDIADAGADVHARLRARPSCTPRAARSGPGPTSTASARRSLPAWPARRRSRPTSARPTTRWRPAIAKLRRRPIRPALLALVRACLALDPLARPQSVFAVQKALQARPRRSARRTGAPAAGTTDDGRARHPAGAAWSGAIGFGRHAPDKESPMQFSVYQQSHIGGRKVNQDRMGYSYTREALLLVLADGMGGHLRGEVAATHRAADHVGRCSAAGHALREEARALPGRGASRRRTKRSSATRASTRMPDTPRTTIVACLVQHNMRAVGALRRLAPVLAAARPDPGAHARPLAHRTPDRQGPGRPVRARHPPGPQQAVQLPGRVDAADGRAVAPGQPGAGRRAAAVLRRPVGRPARHRDRAPAVDPHHRAARCRT